MSAKLRIYLATSWRNPLQPLVLHALRSAGMLVYDFRNPSRGQSGFSWRDVDPDWKEWDGEKYAAGLQSPIAERGFRSDMDALASADACVLLHPCGPSAHLEAGYAIGDRMPTVVAIPKAGPREPELMVLAADRIVVLDDPPGDCSVIVSALGECSRSAGLEKQRRRRVGWQYSGRDAWNIEEAAQKRRSRGES